MAVGVYRAIFALDWVLAVTLSGASDACGAFADDDTTMVNAPAGGVSVAGWAGSLAIAILWAARYKLTVAQAIPAWNFDEAIFAF